MTKQCNSKDVVRSLWWSQQFVIFQDLYHSRINIFIIAWCYLFFFTWRQVIQIEHGREHAVWSLDMLIELAIWLGALLNISNKQLVFSKQIRIYKFAVLFLEIWKTKLSFWFRAGGNIPYSNMGLIVSIITGKLKI